MKKKIKFKAKAQIFNFIVEVRPSPNKFF